MRKRIQRERMRQGRAAPGMAAVLPATVWQEDDLDALKAALRCHHAGDIERAVALYTWLLDRHADNPDLHFNLGVCHHERGHLSAAVREYRAALERNPDLLPAHENLGRVLRAQGRLDEAVASFRRVLEADADNIAVLDQLASALKETGRYEEAIEAICLSLQRKPDMPNALTLLGALYYEKGDVDRAIDIFRQAVLIMPEQAQAHFNLSQCLLLKGEFIEGWREHEWRSGTGALSSLERGFSAPQWRGEPLTGKTILLHAEQGLGDTIQFVRYAALLKASGARIVLECQLPLLRLLQQVGEIDVLVPQGGPLPSFDYYVPLLGLPYLFQTEVSTIPTQMPYLRAPQPGRLTLDAFPFAAKRPRIGLVWSGNPNHSNDQNRSVRFGLFEPLVRTFSDAASFVSLQVGGRQAERGCYLWADGIADPTPLIHDFADTAEVLGQLDILISVDTSVAHLAGAMLLPVWILLPFVPDSRWLLSRQNSPWYPSARLFRQPAAGEWGAVLAQVETCLGDWLKGRHGSGPIACSS